MASPYKGSDIVYMLQLEDATIGDPAFMVAHQTEGTHSIENELMDEQTKFGRILEYGNNSESFEITAYYDRSEGQAAILEGIRKKKKIKAWEVDLNENTDGEYPALFAQCVVESVEKSSESDSFVEYSGTLQVIGEAKEGTLTEEDVPTDETSGYDFETPGETGTEDTSGT